MADIESAVDSNPSLTVLYIKYNPINGL
jgi:hypothetical protein